MLRNAPKGWWGWIMLLQVFIQLKIFRCEKLGYPFPIWWIRKNSVMSFNSKPKSLVITELWIIFTIVHVAITSVTKILVEIFSSFQIFWGWILAVFQLTSRYPFFKKFVSKSDSSDNKMGYIRFYHRKLWKPCHLQV